MRFYFRFPSPQIFPTPTKACFCPLNLVHLPFLCFYGWAIVRFWSGCMCLWLCSVKMLPSTVQRQNLSAWPFGLSIDDRVPGPSTAAWTGQNRHEHKCFKVKVFSKPVSRNETSIKHCLSTDLVISTTPTRRHAALTLLCYHVDEHVRLAAAVWQRCLSWQGNGQRCNRVTARRVRTLTHVHTNKPSPQGSVGRSVCVCVLRQC